MGKFTRRYRERRRGHSASVAVGIIENMDHVRHPVLAQPL